MVESGKDGLGVSQQGAINLRDSNPYVISGEQDTFRLNFKVMSEDNNLDYDKTDTLRTIQLSQRSNSNSEGNHVLIEDLEPAQSIKSSHRSAHAPELIGQSHQLVSSGVL